MTQLLILVVSFLFILTNSSRIYGSGYNQNSRITGNGDYRYEFFHEKSNFDFQKVSQLTASKYHLMVLKNDGDVFGYGQGIYYQFGDGSTEFKSDLTKLPAFPKNISQLSTSYYVTFVVTEQGDLYGCGYDSDGQFGIGTSGYQRTLVKLKSNVTKVSQYLYHKVILTHDGEVYSAGDNSYGQIGDGTITRRYTDTKYQINQTVIDIAVGERFTMVLTTFGTIYGSGRNLYYSLGINDLGNFLIPVLNPGIKNVTSIYASYFSAMAIANETLYSWGYGSRGELGNGEFVSRTETPQKVLIDKRIKQIYLSFSNGYVISEDNELFGWGYNSYRKIYPGSSSHQATPVKISENVTAVVSGDNWNIFIKNETAYASGNNQQHQLPIDPVHIYTTPIAGRNFTLVAGVSYTLVLEEFGDVYGYGSNSYGILNLPSGANRYYYSKTLYKNITQLGAGYRNTLALNTDGELLCVGYNYYGQCATGSYEPVFSPQIVMYNVTKIFKGYHSSFVVRNNSLYAFGYNIYGNLGVGNTLNSYVARKMLFDNITLLQDISSTHYYHTLVLINGSVFSCGRGSYGALGLGDYTTRSIPTYIPTLKEISQISTGYYHSMFLDTNGVVYGCGSNSYRQISSIYRGNERLPIVVSKNAIKVTAIRFSSSILYPKGQIYSFGYNTDLQLGFGNLNTQYTPGRTYPFYRYDNIFSGYEVNFWSGCPNGFYGDYCENNYLLDLFNQLCIDCVPNKSEWIQ
eukprot:gene11244-4064_t